MSPVHLGMSVGGFAVVMGTLVSYLRTIPRHRVPVKVGGLVTGLLVGVALAVGAIGWSIASTGSVGAAVATPAAFAIFMGTLFLWIVSQRKVPAGDLQVKVGDALLPFEATTDEGTAFGSAQLAGKRTLLKFFRGGW